MQHSTGAPIQEPSTNALWSTGTAHTNGGSVGSAVRGGSTSVGDEHSRPRSHESRWGPYLDGNKVANLINLPTAITGALTPEQLEAYALTLRIEEITEKLKLGEVAPPRAERSPSPPPQYDANGRRVNTTEARYRQKLETERHHLVDKALRLIPNYKAPSDYRRPHKTQEKIYIPVNDYPEINFIGLLIGPRGNTLKQMEADSGAKIAIRGKGSLKEGKGRGDNPHQQNMDEDLHCLITSDNEEKIQKAIQLVNKVIETAASIPEGQNELKRGQLRELAALNGTLRDDENQACQNCGELGHRRYDCPHRKNYTAAIKCYECGNFGHMARDCKERRLDQRKHTSSSTDYDRLLEEIDGSRAGSYQRPNIDLNATNANAAPWQRPGPWMRQEERSWNQQPPIGITPGNGLGFNPAPGRPSSNQVVTGSNAMNQGLPAAPPGVTLAPPGLAVPPGLRSAPSSAAPPPGRMAPPPPPPGLPPNTGQITRSNLQPPPPPPSAPGTRRAN